VVSSAADVAADDAVLDARAAAGSGVALPPVLCGADAFGAGFGAASIAGVSLRFGRLASAFAFAGTAPAWRFFFGGASGGGFAAAADAR